MLKAQGSDTNSKLTAAVSAGAEVITLRARVADLEPKATKLQAADAELGKLRTQVAEIAPKLAMAAAAGAEVIALKTHVAQLESQVSKLQSSDAELGKLRSQLADLQQKLQAVADENSRLKAQEGDLQKKLSNMQTSSADTTKHLANLDARNHSFADENAILKEQLADHEAHIKKHADDSRSFKTQLEDLTPKLAAATAVATEVVHLKSHAAELEGRLAEADKVRARLSELEPQLKTAHDELATYKMRWVEYEGKFHAVGEENTQLKTQLAQFAQQHETELTKLRIRVGDLEPQVHQWEARFTSTVAEKDAELSKCRSRVTELETKPAAVVHQHVPAKGGRDDLKKIFGIGPVLEKRLNALGVYFFREIAMWTREDILRYEEHLKEFPDRIERDNWVEGAREEHFKKYGERLLNAKGASA
jgi:predicted flap endonuclease-1-like 5' DNA nuclease